MKSLPRPRNISLAVAAVAAARRSSVVIDGQGNNKPLEHLSAARSGRARSAGASDGARLFIMGGVP